MDAQSLVMLGLLVALFYFMLIRPQQKRLRQHRALLAGLAVGDRIVTIGGIHGVVRQVGEEDVMVEVADQTVIRFTRQAVSRKMETDGGTGETEQEPTEAAAETVAEPGDRLESQG